MDDIAKTWLVSVPLGDQGRMAMVETLEDLCSTSSGQTAIVSDFAIPSFKIGNLDALINQGEALAKLDAQCTASTNKIADIVRTILMGDEARVEEQLMVNDNTPAQYLRTFRWNTKKYRADKSVSELMDELSRETFELENDVRAKFNAYSHARSSLQTLDRNLSGNLAQKSLNSIVGQDDVLQESEYLETVFVAVPLQQEKEFLTSYETLSSMVVPRSAGLVAQDSEYKLYKLVVFKKFASAFAQKAREHKFHVREFVFDEKSRDEEQERLRKAQALEKKLWADTLRLASAAFGDAFQATTHLKALRVFVESVLRYGLPPNFIAAVIEPPRQNLSKAKKALDQKFAYLGGRATTKDKSEVQDETVAALEGAHGGDDWVPYVFFTITNV